jgi:hypothetical protein
LPLDIYFNRPTVAVSASRPYVGARLKTVHPPGFATTPPLNDSPSSGDNCAVFVFPNRQVDLYVYSLQWSGNAKDVALNLTTEHLVSRRRSIAKDCTTTCLTYTARNGIHTRTVCIQPDVNTDHAFGVMFPRQRPTCVAEVASFLFRKSVRVRGLVLRHWSQHGTPVVQDDHPTHWHPFRRREKMVIHSATRFIIANARWISDLAAREYAEKITQRDESAWSSLYSTSSRPCQSSQVEQYRRLGNQSLR